MFDALINVFFYIFRFKSLSWTEEYERFIRGNCHRKIKPDDGTLWTYCKGTYIELRDEIRKFQYMYTDLHYSKTKDLKNFGRAFKAIDTHILTVTAEWRTFFRNNRMDTLSCPTEKLQDIADLTCNQWRDFQAALYELRNQNFRPENHSLMAVAGFIKDQFDALKYLNEIEFQ